MIVIKIVVRIMVIMMSWSVLKSFNQHRKKISLDQMPKDTIGPEDGEQIPHS